MFSQIQKTSALAIILQVDLVNYEESKTCICAYTLYRLKPVTAHNLPEKLFPGQVMTGNYCTEYLEVT